MKNIDHNTITETDEYLIYLNKQFLYFLEYINKDIEKVYHYTSEDILNLILQNSTLRFSNINYLNDECEFTYLFMVLDDLIPQYRNIYSKDFCDYIKETCSYYCDENHYYICEEIRKDLDRQYYVSSFSQNNDSLALWTLYTKNKDFMGCNFAINTNEIYKYLNCSYMSGRVIYSRKEQVNILNELIASWFIKFEQSNYIEYFLGDIRDKLYKYALFFKHPAFEQEQEYRFICQADNYKIITNDDGKQYIDIPFKSNSAIKKITITPTQNKTVYIEKYKSILKKYKCENINITTSSIPFCI